MSTHILRVVRPWTLAFVILILMAPFLSAAPYAAVVMDAASGKVLHSRNADTRLHPASLTKMMTLYIAFEAVKRGELTMDTRVRISPKAAATPYAIGFKAGSRVQLRYLVRAAAVRSSNDAAMAIAEAIEGSQAAFARRMNRTAEALGMDRTTFKNPHGLTQSGHLSTARDMTIMGRRLFYDYPEYYNIFARQSTHAGVGTVRNTNRRVLSAYNGADGIKTGYTNAAGFNLVASAERGCERVIATMFGGRSGASRNARVIELMDMGFARITTCSRAPRLAPPAYDGGRRGLAIASARRPALRPNLSSPVEVARATPNAAEIDAVVAAALAPRARPADTSAPTTDAEAEALEVVTRLSTSGGRHWGISLGRYGSRHQAERALLTTALIEVNTLDAALRKVVRSRDGFEANFVGMTKETAAQACRRLAARDMACDTLGPG